jgi:hypothetical protein
VFYRIMNDVHTVLLSDVTVEELELMSVWVACRSVFVFMLLLT